MILYYLFYLLGAVFFICGVVCFLSLRRYYKTAYKAIYSYIPENTNGEITMTVKENT